MTWVVAVYDETRPFRKVATREIIVYGPYETQEDARQALFSVERGYAEVTEIKKLVDS